MIPAKARLIKRHPLNTLNFGRLNFDQNVEAKSSEPRINKVIMYKFRQTNFMIN